MTAGEDQAQTVVGDRGHGVILQRIFGAQRAFEQDRALRLLAAGALAAQPVDRGVARRRQYPCRGASGETVARPALERGYIGFLQRILGEIDIAQDAGQGRDGASAVGAEAARDLVPRITSRQSDGSPPIRTYCPGTSWQPRARRQAKAPR